MALDFPLTVVFPAGTLEAMLVALLQEILAPVGQQACKPTHLRHLPNLKLSPKENIAPAQPPECFMACSKRCSPREERLLSWANWDSRSVPLSVCTQCGQDSLLGLRSEEPNRESSRGVYHGRRTFLPSYPWEVLSLRALRAFSFLSCSSLYFAFISSSLSLYLAWHTFPFSFCFSPQSWPFLTSLFLFSFLLSFTVSSLTSSPGITNCDSVVQSGQVGRMGDRNLDANDSGPHTNMACFCGSFPPSTSWHSGSSLIRDWRLTPGNAWLCHWLGQSQGPLIS